MSIAAEVPNPRLAAALAYAARGWPVLPLHTATGPNVGDCSCRKDDCEDQGKHPRIMTGLRGASADPKKIREWWDKWPDANVGVRTGKVGDRYLCIIDIDPRNGGDEGFEELERQLGKLPDTYTVHTGSGGRHLYFWSRVPVKTDSHALDVPGVDTRGGSEDKGQGYGVGDSSNHKSGRFYCQDVGQPDEPAELPEAWVTRINRPRLSLVKKNAEGTGELIEDGQVSGPGRKKKLHSIGRSMRAHGCGEDAIRAALREANERQTTTPLDPRDVERVVQHVCRVPPGKSKEYEERPEGSFLRGDDVEIARRMLADLRSDSPEALVEDHGALWRYVASEGIWRRIEEEECYRVLAGYAGLPIGDGRKTIRISAAGVAGAIRCARMEVKRPGFFDAAPSGIAFRNGFLGRDGLQEHSAAHRCRHALPYALDLEAVPERWLRFLREVWAPCVDTEDRIELAAQWIGAALLGEATRYQQALLLVGADGDNGKSVFLSTVRALFPVESVVALKPQLWGNQFSLATLAGARLNSVAELPSADIEAEETFKAVIAGDAISAQHKFRDPFTFAPRAAHLFATNALPGTRDQSKAFWRRWLVLTFSRVFRDDEKDRDLGAKLREELPAIAAWAIKAGARVRARGSYHIPSSAAEAKVEWQVESDQVRQWLAERCVVGAPHFTDSTSLRATPPYYADYRDWAESCGHKPLSIQSLRSRLKGLGLDARTEYGRGFRLALRGTR